MTEIIVSSGQTVSGVTLSAGDTMEVLSGGTALGTQVLSGGELTLSGGTARGTIVKSGGGELVSGGVALGGRVVGGGVAIGPGAARHPLIGSGGLVYDAGLIVDPVISGGTLELGGQLGGSIDFAGIGGSLLLDNPPRGSAHVISGLVPGDIIEIHPGEIFTSGGSATLAAGNELQISEGGKNYTLFLDPKQDFSGFVFSVVDGEVIEHSAKPVDIRVGAGQSVSGTFLFLGDTMVVSAGGSSSRTLLDGGIETLSGGTARRTAINISGGEMIVASGGTAIVTVVSGGGEVIVASGGVARGTILETFGGMSVSSGGVARGTILEYDSFEIVSSGGKALGGAIVDDARLFLLSGAAAFRTTIDAGFLVVDGGVARGTLVDGGGMVVSSGGLARGTVIGGGGATVSSGGRIAASNIDSGGDVFVLAGGVAHGTLVKAGGGIEIEGLARDTVIRGTATVSSGGRIAASKIDGGTLVLDRHYRLGGAIDFAGSGGSLVISGAVPGSAHVISGFAPGDTIDLAKAAFTSAGSAALGAGNELQISEGGKTHTLFFDPKQDFSGFVFTWAGDGHGGTEITEQKASAAAAPAAAFAQSLAATDIRVGSGQTSSRITLGAHDTMEVLSGGTAIGTRVLGGGVLTLSGGATDRSQVRSGGEEIVSSGGAARHTIIGSGGEAFDSLGGRILAPVISGGTLWLERGSRLGGAIDFAGTGGELVIAATALGSTHVISGLAPGDVIDLVFAPFSFLSGGSATLAAGNELEITEGGKTYTLFLDPKQDFSGDGFALAFGDHGGTDVIVHSARPADIRIGSGQSTNGATLVFGDTMEVFAGGSAVRTSVLHGAVLTLSAGTARGTEVGPGGEESVSSGGKAVGTVLSVGAELVVSAGGVTIDTNVGGTEFGSGEETVFTGGIARDTLISSGDLTVSRHGAAFGTTLSGFGRVTVEAGGFARHTAVNQGDINISAGGVAVDTTVGVGGFAFIPSGGLARDLVLGPHGEAAVNGGRVSGAVISSGRLFDNGGSVAGAAIESGGKVIVRYGGRITAPAIGSGGEVFVLDSGRIAAPVIGSGGEVSVVKSGMVAAPVISGGSLELKVGSRLRGSIDFAGSGGSLVVDRNRLPGAANVISGFAPGDTIDLTDVVFTSGGSATLGAGNELQISEGGKTYKLYFDPKQDFSGFVFTWAGDGHGGTLVTEATVPAAAAHEMTWFGAVPAVRSASPMLVDSGTGPGHAPTASLAHMSGGGFGPG